ncbi:hypothetical protein PITCH_A570008 [uncultured Desulfobacterium sp.]|uniref:Uncharacterized protein n=1 Tax=uncultured Desulfobacterium sp. TaxID=201089 RepID=A0A445N0Y5_9BACT|nr:hypothetical protein PITCH_A570008 [uncultured Desulfobacterium sp.]
MSDYHYRINPYRIINQIARKSLCLIHSRLNGACQSTNVTWGFAALDSRLNSTALFMAKDHDVTHTKVFHCVFNASKRCIVYDVSRKSDNENIAKPLIKKHLGRHPGIRTGYDYSKGVLSI